MAAFVNLGATGPAAIEAHDWARAFFAIELGPAVPAEIRGLFEAARGVLVYGWFFYPLYVLGEEQLYRVADAATAERYRQLGGEPTKRGWPPTFENRIKWLVDQDAISPRDQEQWTAIRKLRNIGTHADYQMLRPPTDILPAVRLVAECISHLFITGPSV
jgi:hypothetical protein